MSTLETRLEAARRALALSKVARSAFLEANSCMVGPYLIKPDSPPGVGWVLKGPKGTKDEPAENRVQKYYATKELAIESANRLMGTAPATISGGGVELTG